MAACTTCASPTASYGDRCADCFQIETRLADYLRRGGKRARDFVFRLCSDALLNCPDARRTENAR